ncbi:hypothetical protein PAXINDRAFT_162950 [Paxillus involutus ATCC 200175]|uniref:CBS domain-containing protein n=1 Tax=Paxillus involutus ATCC 200175 TaxID=664439 RepID=A0A0C9TJY6_PAXIN|nr:hypothetical protein PAXINDRAFT_162950 [Paxillus involutus ATCC 200175]
MAQQRRASFSVAHARSSAGRDSPSASAMPQSLTVDIESDEWVKSWAQLHVRDLIDSRIVAVEAEITVEDACEMLLTEDIPCLVVKAIPSAPTDSPFLGLFDFSDVNAFLTLAATRHTIPPHELKANSRADQIMSAARSGRVPVHLVSNLSEKNFLEVLPYEANVISLLSVFARGTHRVLIRSPSPSATYLGMVSDMRLLSWFSTYAERTPEFQSYLANSLHALSLPSLHMYSSVIATSSTAQVIDAMRLMSEQGVSSVAVIDEALGTLLSAVSVTDIGKIVVPSQSKHILFTPVHQFIAQIKEPDGSTDGVDKSPIYVVFPTSTLLYTIQKLLATNSHRLFVTDNDFPLSSSPSISNFGNGNLCGIVSIVDILSLFARIAHIADVDPTQRMRHRRASASSHSSHSSQSGLARDLSIRSRSSSRTSMRLSGSPRVVATTVDNRNSISSLDALQWSELVSPRKEDGK